MSTSESPEDGIPGSGNEHLLRRRHRFFLRDLPIRHRLPLLIGTLLLGIFAASALASYRAVRESALDVGRERLRTLTNYLATQLQQQGAGMGTRTATSANELAIRAFLQSPSAPTREGATASLKLLTTSQDLSNLQVELWNTTPAPALTVPEGAAPVAADLDLEFKQSTVEPFKAIGAIRIINGTPAFPVVAATRDDSGKPLGYLVRWRKLSANPESRKQLTDIVGNQAVLYMGNAKGDIWTDLVKATPKPPVSLDTLTNVTDYQRDTESIMALGRPVAGTPWFVVIEFPTRPVLAEANKFLRRMIVVSLLLLGVGVTASVLLSRNITKPLHSLTQAAAKISTGDYRGATVDTGRNDELGTLATAFDAMVVKVHNSQRDLERKVKDRTAQLEAAAGAIVMVDRTGLVTMANARTEQLFGYEPGELFGQPVETLVPERYRAAHPGHRTSFFQRPSTRAMGAGRDLFGRRKDGSEVPIEIGLNPIKTDEGELVLASIIDITERKRAEEVLRKSEERLHIIIENLSEGLVISDLNGQLLHWNQTGLKMHGFSNKEEWLVKLPEFQKIFELSKLDGSVLKLEEWPLARIINGEHLASYEVCLRRIDKDWMRIFSYGGGLVHEANGEALAFVTITDITEPKQAEEKLRRSQEQLAGVIGSAMDAIITIDDEQRIVLFNGSAERMFLFPSEDAIGQPLDRFIPERFRAVHKGHIEGFGQTHVTRRSMGALGALFGLRADGEEFPIEASISQVKADGRKLYTVILRDVTERKRADESLKEQARILDLAPVLIRDLNGRILFWNAGSEQMYGWKTEEALDKLTHNLLQTKFPRPIEEIKARLLAHGHWEGELVHTRKDGRRLVIASHWVLHRDENNKPKAVLEVNNDITERKQAEKEIRRLNEELEQRVADRTAQLQAANKELEAFSYSVSHDLRAPLRHINGFSQALLEDYEDKLDDAGKNYLHEVRSASQEMAQLIDDVLQLARVTRSEMRSELVNLSELASNIVGELQKTEAQRKIAVNIEDGLSARGDKRLLRIVLTNLLGNAWKFTSKRKQAEIAFGEAKTNGDKFYFVRDNGAGFDMAYGNKLFGAFQRLHTAGEFEGTGIGLATVQRIVYRHGGRVWAEGTVNEGATFYFTLPNSKEQGDG